MTTFADVAALVDNSLSYPEGRKFAAILGATPSKGARSPALWNAAFTAHDVAAEMLPLDVTDARLEQVLQVLDYNQQFVGGAVAVPHKEAVARWLGARVSPEAADIGAVNCLYRDASGRLAGTNTDGEGALRSFEAQSGPVAGKRVLLLGLGGSGKAVAAFFRRAVGANGRLTLANRSSSGQTFANKLSTPWCSWAELGPALRNADVLVNCTSVGSGAQAGSSPLTKEQVGQLAPGVKVFDIIYQPSPSALLVLAAERGLGTLDGSVMNLEQAVLAYGHAAPAPKGPSVTLAAMEEAKKKLG